MFQHGRTALTYRIPVHSLRPPRLTVLFAAVALAVSGAMPPSVGADADDWGPSFKDCGSFKAGAYRIEVYASKVTCKKAKRIQRELWLGSAKDKESVNGGSGASGYVKLKRFPGWRCTSGSGGGSCKKGKSVAAYEN